MFFVNVLVLNYNSCEATIEYVKQLRKQQDVNINILVVDNCSLDDSYNVLHDLYSKSSDIQIIQSHKNGGYAYGNNFGLKFLEKHISLDEFVIVSNNDIEIDDNKLIYNLINNYMHCDNPGFISPVMYVDKNEAKNCSWVLPNMLWDIRIILPFKNGIADKILYKFKENNKLNCKVDCLPGSFFMGKLITFKEIDYFDERTFLYGEERIIAKKVELSGKSNYLIRSLKYHHLVSKTISTEINNINQIRLVLQGREIYHQFYGEANLFQLYFLKMIHFLYLHGKKIEKNLFNA